MKLKQEDSALRLSKSNSVGGTFERSTSSSFNTTSHPSGVKLFDSKRIAISPINNEFTESNEPDEIMKAIEKNDKESVNSILNKAATDPKKLQKILCMMNKEGQTPLHAAIIQLHSQKALYSQKVQRQKESHRKINLKELESGKILIYLLSAHVKAELNIIGEHKNQKGLSPMQLATLMDEEIAFFLSSQYTKMEAAKNKLTIGTSTFAMVNL
jgi:hypothetical protein